MSLVRLRPEAPRCRNSGAVCGRSSSGRARPCQGRGSEFEPRRPLQKHHPIGWRFFRVRLSAHHRVSRLPAATAADSRDTSSKAPRFIRRRRRFGAFLVARSKNTTLSGGVFFVCVSALTGVSAGCRRLPQPTAGTLPRKRLASSAAGGASALSSSPAPKKKDTHVGCLSFLVQHFCCAKVVACGRVIERERGNPSKVPPSHSPFLAVGGSADNKTCGQSQNTTLQVVFFCVRLSAHRRVSQLPAATFFSLLRHISRSHDKEMGETDEI